jgi:hypothetical protein
MAEKDNLLPLKILVGVLGVMLLVGVAVLIALAVHRPAGPGGAIAAEAAPATASECDGKNVDLRGHGAIINSAIDGKVLRVMFADDDDDTERTEVVTVDTCTGKVLADVKVMSDPGEDDDCSAGGSDFVTPQL